MNLSITYRKQADHKTTWSILLGILAAALFIRTSVFLGSVLNVGPELSDSAFYILMRSEYADVQSMFSGFGVILAAFAGESDIQTIRLFSFIFTFSAPVIFLLFAERHSISPENSIMLTAGIIITGCATLSCYGSLLLDPNYNNMTIPVAYVCALCLWALWDEFQRPKGVRWRFATLSAVLLGAGILSLCWLKLSSGIIFVLIAFPLYTAALIANAGTSMRQTLLGLSSVYALAAVGACLVFFAISARTLPAAVLWERFVAGFETTRLLKTHNKSLHAHTAELFTTIHELIEILLTNPLTIVLPLLGLAVLVITQAHAKSSFGLILSVLVLAPLTILVLENLDNFKFLAKAGWAFSIVCSLLVLIRVRKQPKQAFFAALFAWTPYGLSFGTGNTIINHAVIFSGTALTAIFIAGQSVLPARSVFVTCVVILGTGLTLSAFDQAQQSPYRMQEPLEAANKTFIVNGENWRVTPSVAQTYYAMEKIRESPVWLKAHTNNRPILLDLSGRAPILNWLGDFRVPSLAWTISDYNGSDAQLSWALNHVNPKDLKNMWVAIDDPNETGVRKGLSVEVLNNRLNSVNLEFPEDYCVIGGDIPIAYMNRTARIFAPKLDKCIY